MHLVHKRREKQSDNVTDDNGSLAVVGVFFDVNPDQPDDNKHLAPLTDALRLLHAPDGTVLVIIW
jgi:hypothetical protein